MLFAVVKSLKEADAVSPLADGVELRLDHFEKIDLSALKLFLNQNVKPVLFTLAKRNGNDSLERMQLLEKLFALQPAYFDLEYEIEPAFLMKMVENYPRVKIIGSYHHFEETPIDLEGLFSTMQSPFFYAYKIATMANSTLDALRMFQFARDKTKKGIKLTGVCMGEKGQLTRILGPVCGNYIDFAPTTAQSSTAPGQLTIEELTEIYQYKTLNRNSSILGLIGDPVNQSVGHLAHNAVMKAFKLNAVYVKMPLRVKELEAFFSLARKIGFSGLSVTMPLKEAILPYLDGLDEEAKQIGSVNTILNEGGRLFGFNTDGKGALDAIEQQGLVLGKTMVVVGAGGAAKAIAYVAHQRGADLVIINRTFQKAAELALQVDGRAGTINLDSAVQDAKAMRDFEIESLLMGTEHSQTVKAASTKSDCGSKDCDDLVSSTAESKINQIAQEWQQGYDLLVNCTPNPLPIDPQYICPGATFMDIRMISEPGSLLFYAKQKGAQVIYGSQMFIKQAVLQELLWFKEKVDLEQTSSVIFHACTQIYAE